MSKTNIIITVICAFISFGSFSQINSAYVSNTVVVTIGSIFAAAIFCMFYFGRSKD